MILDYRSDHRRLRATPFVWNNAFTAFGAVAVAVRARYVGMMTNLGKLGVEAEKLQ